MRVITCYQKKTPIKKHLCAIYLHRSTHHPIKHPSNAPLFLFLFFVHTIIKKKSFTKICNVFNTTYTKSTPSFHRSTLHQTKHPSNAFPFSLLVFAYCHAKKTVYHKLIFLLMLRIQKAPPAFCKPSIGIWRETI